MTRIADNKQIVYPKESYVLNGFCYEAHNKLGRFCREKQYAETFEGLLAEGKIEYKREFNLGGLGNKTGGNVVDFIVYNKILVDFKAKSFITKEDYYQMLRYLKCSSLKLGLLVNFRDTHLKPKRIINLN